MSPGEDRILNKFSEIKKHSNAIMNRDRALMRIMSNYNDTRTCFQENYKARLEKFQPSKNKKNKTKSTSQPFKFEREELDQLKQLKKNQQSEFTFAPVFPIEEMKELIPTNQLK